MDNYKDLIHQRNVLVLKLLWGFYILTNVLNIVFYGEPIDTFPPIGFLLASIISFLVWKGISPRLIMYLIITSVFGYFFIILNIYPFIINVLLVWVGLLLSIFYLDNKVTLLAGLYSISMIIYLFNKFRYTTFVDFDNEDIVFLLAFTLFVFMFLRETSKFTVKLLSKVQDSEQKLKEVLDNVDIITWYVDVTNKKIDFTVGIEKLCGYPISCFKENIGFWKEIVYYEDINELNKAYSDLMIGKSRIIEYRIVNSKGKIQWLQNRIIPKLDKNGKVVRLDGVILDITKRKSSEEEMKHMAYHDQLTGLPNRSLLDDYFSKAILQARTEEQKLGVMFIDLDNFKLVNDTKGHIVGDLLLKEVANRLKSVLRQTDTIYRIGGDEFIILLNCITEEEVVRVANRVEEAFAQSFTVKGHTFYVELSIGISIYPDDGNDMDELINNADNAMYFAKSHGTSYEKYKAANS